jgi:hypothetical protein
MTGKDLDKELSEKYCQRFGKVAVNMGFVTPEQLKQALVEQFDDEISDKPHRPIGTILFEHGWITVEQIDKVMDRIFRDKKERA